MNTEELREKLTIEDDPNALYYYLAELNAMSNGVASVSNIDWRMLYKLTYELYMESIAEHKFLDRINGNIV